MSSDAQKRRDSDFEEGGFLDDLQAANSGRLDGYSSTQLFFLMRLSKLLSRRQECEKSLAPTDRRMKSLNKAIYSTYSDCVELGICEDARALFHRKGETDTQTSS